MRLIFFTLLLCGFVHLNSSSQTIVPFAGGGQGDGLQAIKQSIQPNIVLNDSAGNIYFTNSNLELNDGGAFGTTTIRRVDVSTGIISTLAGGRNPLIPALNGDVSILLINHADMYVYHNNYIKKVDLNTYAISTVAGNGISGYSGDGGLATNASIDGNLFYTYLCIDNSGNIYFSENANHAIRKIDASTHIISTFLNTANPAIHDPKGICLDGSGNLLIADRQSGLLLANLTTSVISGFTGIPALHDPYDVKVDNAGNIFVAESSNNWIRKITSVSTSTIYAGNGATGYYGDYLQATSAAMNLPRSISLDGLGNMYISDVANNVIRKVNSSGIITTVAGNHLFHFGGDGGLATNANLNNPTKLTKDNSGNIYFVDQGNGYSGTQTGVIVRKIDASTGIITTVAGNGTAGFSGDGGPAINAKLDNITGICTDLAGNLYIADGYNKRIRKVTASTGIISSFAGNGSSASGNGGLAISAGIGNPKAVTVDASDNVYVSDGNTIRKIDASTGIIDAYAGGGAYLGDGGPATSALVNAVTMCFDSQGNLIIGDLSNKRIRKIDNSTGIITTVAGNGAATSFGNNINPLSASFWNINTVCVDATDNIYVAGDYSIRKINAAGTLIFDYAGTGYSTSGIIASGTPVFKANVARTCAAILDNSGNMIFTLDKLYKINTSCISTPTVSLGNDVNQCNGTVVLNPATNATYYYWDLAIYPSAASNTVSASGTQIVTVTDVNGCSASDTVNVQIEQCVWPGDANNDQIVDASDLLPIGLYFGNAGVTRSGASNNWVGQPCANWSQNQSNGTNLKYADSNGDGQIGFSDTTAIHLNSGLIHQAKPLNITTSNTAYFSFDKSSYNPGDTVKATLVLGSAMYTLFNFYGSSFDVAYDASIVKPGSETFRFLNTSWIGQLNTNAISYANVYSGNINASIVRINHNNVTGYGNVAQFKFVLNNTLSSTKLYLNIQNGVIISNSGGTYSFSGIDSVTVVPGTVTNISNQAAINVSVYPNPSTGEITINPYSSAQQLIVYNVIGDRIMEKELHNVPLTVELKTKGVYFLVFSGNNGHSITKKVIIE